MKYLFLFLAAFLLFTACDTADVPKDLPVCMKKLVRESMDKIEEVWRYQYKNESVYVIIPVCCDQYTDAYTSRCEKICSPDGGITGKGDGQCADFYQQVTGKELLWKKK